MRQRHIISLLMCLLALTATPKTKICAWGDSFTAGAGSKDTSHLPEVLKSLKKKGYKGAEQWSNGNYCYYLGNMLGDDYECIALGVGGETSSTIASRMGVNPIIISEDFILPADGSAVQISEYGKWFDSVWGAPVSPLLQGEGKSVNPCYVGNIECRLAWTGKAHNDQNGTYTIKRVRHGDGDVVIPKGTPLIMYGANAYRDADITVIWAYQNGGYKDNDDLVRQLREMVESLPTDKYIVVGVHTGAKESRLQQEAALQEAFGDKFFNWREYISSSALKDFGIKATAEDKKQMRLGACPPTLLYDKYHLTAAGYAILAYKLKERMQKLQYIK